MAFYFLCSFPAIVLLFHSCSKEYSAETIKKISVADTIPIVTGNRPPIANAGPDQTINLPITGITLDGINSTDPDNNIINYVWTRISGPSSFLITYTSLSQVIVTSMATGTHLFELKVTDAGGLSSRDTMQVKLQ